MAAVWNRFFKKGPGVNKILEALPEEILVDHIMVHLHVKDILRLRQVSKSFAFLTKKPAVWKRFLPLVKNLPQPLAPLPPTSQYRVKNISSMDIEHIVTKAISLDDNLRSDNVRPWFEYECLAYGEVSDIVLLPGGHFLITSVTYQDGRCGIMLWAVQHPATGVPAPILFRETEVKAYALQAKYMTVMGKKGICVSFLRKRHKKRGDKRDIPENAEMGGREDPEDPYMPLKYECTTIHISMHAVEMLTDRRIPPQTPEFDKLCRKASIDPDGELSVFVVSRIRTGTQLGVVSLDIINGRPYVCVVKRPDQIILECLDDGVRSILHCLPFPAWPHRRHSVWNFRVLPEQGHIFIVRAVEKDETWPMNYYILDLFLIPQPNEKLSTTALHSSTLVYEEILNVQIAPSKAPTIKAAEDPSITPYLFEDRMPPPPLSLYLRTRNGVEHHSLWPIFIQAPPSPPDSPQTSGNGVNRSARRLHGRYHYDLGEHWIIRTGGKRFGVHQSLRVLPGSYNAFMYEVPHGYLSTTPPVRSLWSYVYKGEDHTRRMSPEWNNLLENGPIPPDVDGGIIGGLATEEHEVESLLMGVDSAGGIDEGNAPENHLLLFERKSIHKRKQLEPVSVIEKTAAAITKGISGICWDEDTGRIMVATLDRHLRLMDFAYSRHSDELDEILNKGMDLAIEEEEHRLSALVQMISV